MSTQERLKTLIKERVVIRHQESGVPLIGMRGEPVPWILDFRAVLMEPEFLELFCELFWNTYENRAPFQVGGMESAALPLVTAIVMSAKKRGISVTGFYVRKSRKPTGQQKNIEGTLTDAPIILVDDMISSGTSLMRQIAVLKEGHKRVDDIFVLVRSRESYRFAKEADIRISAPFSLRDFGLSLHSPEPLPDHAKFSVHWAGKLGTPNYFLRAPKPAPVIDETHLYICSDKGALHAIEQETGDETWVYRMRGYPVKTNKAILSSPALYNGVVYFGAYDGNFYAIDAKTGKERWVNEEADAIGSSPVVAPDLGTVYVGLEYGLWKRHGGIIALDATTGAVKWHDRSVPTFTHGSPAYSARHRIVVIGSNNGVLYAYEAKTGKPLWQFQSGGAIKGKPTFDDERGYVLFGTEDGCLYTLSSADGSFVHKLETRAAIYATPLVYKDLAYIGSTDKHVYCLNLDTLRTEWIFATGGRIFASPAAINDMIYIGSNDGKLYELYPGSGMNTAFFQTTERIVSQVAYDRRTSRFFLATFANELYCLSKQTPT